MPAGGSRHYTGPGLGTVGMWKCPGCGGENAGPLERGCELCGAGKPGYRAEPPPPPPMPATPPVPAAVEDERERLLETAEIIFAAQWVADHPEASVIEAFAAGYLEGGRMARAHQPQPQPAAADVFPPEDRISRTVIVALILFRDQVLAGDEPPEVTSGEWLSGAEIDRFIARLQQG